MEWSAEYPAMYWFDNIRGSICQITLEPVFFLFCLNSGLIKIASQSLYLNKACKVNLGHNDTVCDNIQEYEEVQVETQQYVSQIQAYNGMLQVRGRGGEGVDRDCCSACRG